MLANGSPLRNRLIQAGFTTGQMNVLDAHLEDTYFDSENYEYADNLRIARVNRPNECEEYEETKRCGCCGFFDQEIEHPDGNILIGFNYGH